MYYNLKQTDMMKINTTVYELDVVFQEWSQAKIWNSISILREVKSELEFIERHADDTKIYNSQFEEELETARLQLVFVNKNIKTLQNALLAWESKIFEKRPSLGSLQMISLN